MKRKLISLWHRVWYGRGNSTRRKHFLRGEQAALIQVSDQLQTTQQLHAEQSQLYFSITKKQIEDGAKQFADTLQTNNTSHHDERKVWMQTILSERAELINDHLKQMDDLKAELKRKEDEVEKRYNAKDASLQKEHRETMADVLKQQQEVVALKDKWKAHVDAAEASLHKITLTLETIANKKADVLRRLAELVAMEPNVGELSEELGAVKKAITASMTYDLKRLQGNTRSTVQ